MNKISKMLVAACTLAVATFSANAQMQFGAKAGVNITNVGDLPSGAESLDSKIGFHIGGVIDFPINDNIFISPEVLFSTKGAKSEYSFLGFDVKETLNFSYIEVPINLKYQMESGLNFHAGPYIGILAGVKYTSEVDGDKETSTDKEGINSLDFGLNFGLGYKLESGLFFGARYGLGLAKVFEETTVTYEDPISGLEFSATQDAYGKHSNIMVSIGYMFGGE